MRKVVGFIGFLAHFVLSVTIIILDFVRTLIAWVYLDTVRDEYGTFSYACACWYGGTINAFKISWKKFMGEELVTG